MRKRQIESLEVDQAWTKRAKVSADDVDSAYISQASTSPQAFDTISALRPFEVAGSVTTAASKGRPKTLLCTFAGCDKAFDRPARLEIHIRSHTKERPFACEEPGCDKTFVRSEHLKAHVKAKHSDQRDYVCTYSIGVSETGEVIVCGKSFHTGTRLRRHVAAHEDKEQTKCQECGQIFRKQETLQRHIRAVHLDEHAYRCAHSNGEDEEECGQTFATVGQLRSHEARSHSGSRFFCDLCPSTDGQQPGFTTYSALQQHLKTVHPPTCGLCGHIAQSNRGLKAHMEIVHQTLADRQRFECTVEGCDRKFTKQGNLKVHIQTVHAKVKAYVCGNYDLSSSSNVPNWSGVGCGSEFSSKVGLEGHVRTQHLGLPPITSSKDRQPVTPIPGNGPALSGLTGHGYDTRPVACLELGCQSRFNQDHDLAIHLELHHGWNMDDINDALVEANALEGDKFWIGGFDEMHHALEYDLGNYDNMAVLDGPLPLAEAMDIDPALVL